MPLLLIQKSTFILNHIREVRPHFRSVRRFTPKDTTAAGGHRRKTSRSAGDGSTSIYGREGIGVLMMGEFIARISRWSRTTKRFAEHVDRLTAITTNQEAGWFLGLNDEAVYRINKEVLEEKARQHLCPPPAAIHIKDRR